MTSTTLGGGLTETRTYDNRERLTSVVDQNGSQVAYSLALGYLPDGDIATADDSVNGDWTYGYDSLNRLVSASEPGLAFAYVYDRYGNRLQQNVTQGNGPGVQLGFTGNNQMVGYIYDAAGNLLSDGENRYRYDAENRIACVDPDPTTWQCTSTSIDYVYNTFGQRIADTQNGSEMEEYWNDAAGRRIVTRNGGGWNNLSEEIYAGDRHLATYTPTTPYLDLSDGLGTERVRTDINGNVAETCSSLPFGDWQSCTNTDLSPVHFGGLIRDSESGLDYTNARQYTSQFGHWLSPDPLGGDITNPQSLNRYAYVLNNPTTLVDPTGLQGQTADCGQNLTGCVMHVTSTSTPMPPLGGPSGIWDPGIPLRYRPGSPGGGGILVAPPSAPKPNIIYWPQLQKLVHENDESLFGCDELVDCIIFKESSRSGGFNANAVPLNKHGEPIPGATARGLMEVTLGAAADVAGAPPGSAAAVNLHNQLFNPATNVQTGSRYLDILYVRFGGWRGALAHYGTGSGYADDVLNCVEDLFLGDAPGAMEDARGGP